MKKKRKKKNPFRFYALKQKIKITAAFTPPAFHILHGVLRILVQFFSLKYFIGIPLIKPGACTRQSKYM
jgi:hypothetical protein